MRHRLAPAAVLWLCAVTRKPGSARRDACAGAGAQGPAAVADCIGRAYDERIAELEVVRTQPPTAARFPQASIVRYARTPVEQAICSDPALAAKDRRMARLYERAEARDSGRSSRFRVLGSPPVTAALGWPARH